MIPVSSYALEIKSIHLHSTASGEQARIDLSEKVPYKLFSATSPNRLVMDIPTAHWTGKPSLPANYQGYVKGLRFGYFNTKTTRIVLELKENVHFSQSSAKETSHLYTINLDMIANAEVADKEPVAPVAKPVLHKNPVITPESHAKPVIILDAGHGGQDAGTSGYNGSKEKNLTLKYVKLLAAALNATGKYQALLTRSDDRYLFLQERVQKAHALKGNLFISIHADSENTGTARGLSIYTISDKASDKQAEALATKENKADVIGGMDLSGTSKEVADILIDLTQRETKRKAEHFANRVVANLRPSIHLLVHPHRFAGFAVLKSPDIPSVLIEMGFITNESEEKLLQTDAHQQLFVKSMIAAINGYFK